MTNIPEQAQATRADESDRLGGWVSRQVVQLGMGYLDDRPAAVTSLARLRHASREGDSLVPVGAWPALAGLPQRFLGSGDQPTASEFAAATAFQLFAIHQQGRRERLAHQDRVTLGASCRALGRSLGAEGVLAPGVVRRFQSLGTTREATELVWHLRHVVRMLRAEGVPLDYGRLAGDLQRWYRPQSRDGVLLSWSRGFYTPGRSTSGADERPLAQSDDPTTQHTDQSGASA